MRVITPIEGIRLRYGKVNEQAFTLASLPISIIQAGIWLNGLAVFAFAVFGVGMNVTIVVIMSVTGGAWVLCSFVKQFSRLLTQADSYFDVELPATHPNGSSTYMGIAIVNLALFMTCTVGKRLGTA